MPCFSFRGKVSIKCVKYPLTLFFYIQKEYITQSKNSNLKDILFEIFSYITLHGHFIQSLGIIVYLSYVYLRKIMNAYEKMDIYSLLQSVFTIPKYSACHLKKGKKCC